MVFPAVGLGYRVSLHEQIVEKFEKIEFLEITLDHYFAANSIQKNRFENLHKAHSLVSHGVGLSIGSDAPLNENYLDDVSHAISNLKINYYSEHLAFTRINEMELAVLLPLPRTEEVAEKLVKKIQSVQNKLSVPFLIENISYYFEYPNSTLSEVEFFSLICKESNCGILLDIQNLYVNSINHEIHIEEFISSLPQESVKAVHIAGGIWQNDILIDNHGSQVADSVFEMIGQVLSDQNPEYIILERDSRLEEFDEIQEDLNKIHQYIAQAN